jgi:hypothetical protein
LLGPEQGVASAMQQVLLTGGVLRPNGFELGEGKYYEAAKLVRLDLVSGKAEELLCFNQPNEHYPAEYPNLQFTAGCVDGDKLWLPTDTELHCYAYPSLEKLKVFSHPFFHNCHSVSINQGKLVVTSTGLDLVAILDKESGEVLELINAEGKETWHRFSPDVDYRIVYSTRPHDCHPNYIFELENKLWVTRCTQEDAVCLTDTGKRIDVSGKKRPTSVHDGVVDDDRIIFTTVDDGIIIVNSKNLEIEKVIDLAQLEGRKRPRGWCRGILLDGQTLYVAFSKLRKTRTKSRLAWLNRFSDEEPYSTCSVVEVDLKKPRVVREFLLPAGMMDAIYSILPEPGVSQML